jgi:hypothetical protein
MENVMSNVVKTVAAAALALSFAGYAAAQTQNPNADTRPFPQDGTTTQPYSNEEPTNAPGDPAVGSRAIGPPATGQAPDVAPETPADKNTTNLKKLDKQGRGGQQN